MKPKLTSNDVRAILLLKKLAEGGVTTNDAVKRTHYFARLKETEGELSKAASHWWFNETSRDLAEELARWHPEFKVERTAFGYKATRFIKSGKRYATKPTRTGMTNEQAESYRDYYRK